MELQQNDAEAPFIFKTRGERVLQIIGAKPGDLKKPVEKEYVVLFDSGVYMIRDRKTNNHVCRGCYVPTRCRTEKESISAVSPAVTPDAFALSGRSGHGALGMV